MAASRCALRFDCFDRRMGMDSVLANDCRRASYCNCVACKVSEGAALIVDSAVWMAFLDGVRGPCLASGIARRGVLAWFEREAVIEERLSENIGRSQSSRRDQVVFERRLLARRQTHAVLG